MKTKTKSKSQTITKTKFTNREYSIVKEEDVQLIGEFISTKLKGLTTKEMLKVVREHPKHPINNYLEWNDKVAGLKYRLVQLRHVIRSISIEVEVLGETEPVNTQCFVNVSKLSDNEPRGYQPITKVLKDDRMRQQMINKSLSELRSWVESNRVYPELQKLVKVVDRLVTGMGY